MSMDDTKSVVQTVSLIKPDNPTITNINPLDVAENDSQLEKGNWYCCLGTYENGVITCTIPKIDNFSQNQVEYNVDIAINGQQFSGYPMIYRFYQITIDKMEPNISPIEGGLVMKILGTGFFDSVAKKAKISSTLGERYTDMHWDRNAKSLSLVSNPLIWICSEQDITKTIQPQELYENYNFDVHITMNNIDWIYAGVYKYCDPKITRISYAQLPDNITFEQVCTSF